MRVSINNWSQFDWTGSPADNSSARDHILVFLMSCDSSCFHAQYEIFLAEG